MSPDPIPTLTYRGVVYRLPFAHLLRPLDKGRERWLRQSISTNGVLYAAKVYDSDTWGPNCLIDGAHRLRFAAEIGVDDAPPPDRRPDLDDDQARELAENLNPDRPLKRAKASAAGVACGRLVGVDGGRYPAVYGPDRSAKPRKPRRTDGDRAREGQEQAEKWVKEVVRAGRPEDRAALVAVIIRGGPEAAAVVQLVKKLPEFTGGG